MDLERQTAPALLVAEYDEKGALLDVRMVLGTGAACETLACRYPMINAGNQLKLFVWKSMEQFIPARPAAAVPAEQ